MSYRTVITAQELRAHLGSEDWAVVDCRFALDDTERGRRDYLQAHIPGAVYAHLDEDLCGSKIPGKTGRHPFPELGAFARRLSAWGIDSRTQAVAYDGASGSMAAARLWWMLQWAGHTQAAVLDGGWALWQESGLPSAGGAEFRRSRQFVPQEVREILATADQVEAASGDPNYLILDARSGARYRGEVEPIDPVAGHIPGALSTPYEENLAGDGTLLPPDALRRRFAELIKSVSPENVICYCGSGVTAAQNLLAIAHAGMGRGRLYAGSWSEWITRPERAVAR